MAPDRTLHSHLAGNRSGWVVKDAVVVAQSQHIVHTTHDRRLLEYFAQLREQTQGQERQEQIQRIGQGRPDIEATLH